MKGRIISMKKLSKIYLALVFMFLYVPIFVMIVF